MRAVDTMKKKGISDVVEGGYCVGCGACAFVTKSKMKINSFGEYNPDLVSIEESTLDNDGAEFVCPSLNPELNENVLAETFLDSTVNAFSDHIGYHNSIYGGYVIEDEFRANGTSGGFGTWIGAEMFRKGLIDGVIHVKEVQDRTESGPLFTYGLSTTLDQICAGSRTKYHVVEISEILQLIKGKPGKYLFMGLPCMVKALRRIQLVDPVISKSIKFTAALVCGHLKSINWTLSLAWGAGVSLSDLYSFRYRIKGKGIPARAYIYKALYTEDNTRAETIENTSNVVGGKFNQGALMLQACNFCDDLVGETADITIGDAWLPRYEVDSHGSNLLISRSEVVSQLLAQASSENRISLDQLSEADAMYAQAGGFRQRREGLSFRLKLKDEDNVWRPVKRITPDQYSPPFIRKLIYMKRSAITDQSRLVFKRALEKSNFQLYESTLKFPLKVLRLIEIISSGTRIIEKRLAYFKLRHQKR